MDNLLVMILLMLEVGWAAILIYILFRVWRRYKKLMEAGE